MGRLPDTFRQKKIISRVPYAMEARITLVSLQQNIAVPVSSFLHDVMMPFEIHRFIPRVIRVDENGDVVSDLGDFGLTLVDAQIHDYAKNQDLIKVRNRNPITQPLSGPPMGCPLINLTSGTSERTWEWTEPYYLVKTEGFRITLNATDFAAVFDDVTIAEGIFIRVQLSFEGFLVDTGGQ